MAVKKLIEVALPLEAINAESSREKQIRFGHPSTLHLWWARRPLATARAVIWASLVDDPSSHPDKFPTEEEQTIERERLFKILEELVLWKNSNNPDVLERARAEIKSSIGDERLSLLDPFAGGGAIPFEAQRLGLEAYAQDLNPVAVMINKAMVEIPPKFFGKAAINPESRSRSAISSLTGCNGLADDVEYYGSWMRSQAYERIGDLYPQVELAPSDGGGKANVIAWLWARTIKCPNPACEKTMPLISSLQLSRKRGHEAWLKLTENGDGFNYEVVRGKFSGKQLKVGRGAKFHCAHCGAIASEDSVKENAMSGRMGSELIAIVVDGPNGRIIMSPNDEHKTAAIVERPDDYPDANLPYDPRNIWCPNYGLDTYDKLFTNRQLVALTTFSDLVVEAQHKAEEDAIAAGMSNDGVPLADGGTGARAYGEAVGVYLGLGVSRLADICNSLCRWEASKTQVRNMFGRQAIPMIWDYAENNIFGGAAGDYETSLGSIIRVIRNFQASTTGHAKQFDAQSDNGMRGIVISTDPPYYDNIAYADLSDFFYVWLRRSLRNTYPKLFGTMLVPKAEELVATPYRDNRGVQGARDFFENGMYHTFCQVHEYARDDVPVTIYYAFKQSETESVNEAEATASTGWETMLSAIIRSGFSIVGTWPMRTELDVRMISAGTNALASSIVLVCRKRPTDAPMATRREFVNTLKRELKPALDKLQTSNIAPVDMAQSAIGPGIGVYSRYAKVLEADGSEMTVRAALQIINQELDLYFSDQDSDLDRESRFCVDLYTQCAFNEIKFGEADVLARAKNTSIDGLAAKGALYASKGVVRLLGRDELKDSSEWGFMWLFTQQLTHAMETGGVEACAKMLKDVFDSRAENAKALAYRLFTIADRQGWNAEAFAYNSLVVAWPEIQSRAAQLQADKPEQFALNLDV